MLGQQTTREIEYVHNVPLLKRPVQHGPDNVETVTIELNPHNKVVSLPARELVHIGPEL
jgi:hypothetical protein